MRIPLRQIGVTAISSALLLASTVIGLTWLSIALARWFDPAGHSALAALYTALVFFAPIVLYALVTLIARASAAQSPPRLFEDTQTQDALGLLSTRAQSLFKDRPAIAVALLVVAGLVVSRYPSAVTMLAQALGHTPPDDDLD